MSQAIRKLSGLLVLPVLLAVLLIMPVGAKAEGHECYAELPVHVELNGETDEQFHVTIAPASEEDPAVSLPAEAENGLWITGDSDGKFTNFYYTEPGNYEYVVKQECGDTAYMSYDDTVYYVVIQVTNTEDGGLSYQVFAWTDANSEDKAQAISFLDTYAPPTPTPKDEHPDIAEGIANGTWGSTPTPKPTTSTLPQTSDSLPLTALVLVLVVAAAAIVVLVAVRRRKNGQNDQQ